MTTFIIIATALIVVALALVAPALLRNRPKMVMDRNQQNVVIAQERLSELEADLNNGVLTQAQFDQSKKELEQALLYDINETDGDGAQGDAPKGHGRFALIGLAIIVPAITVGMYLYLGTPEMVGYQPGMQVAQQPQAGHGGEDLPPVEDMVSSLEQHLQEEPGDAEGWYLLGRTYMVMKNYPKAVNAFEKTYELVGESPSIMLSLADALAMSRSGNMRGTPAELIRKAVLLAPQDTTALWLAGMVEQQAGNAEAALAHFRNLKPQLADDPQSLSRINGFIHQLESQLQETQAAETAQPVQAQPEAAPASIDVRVALADELVARSEPDQTVFVYAKAVQGPPMPLAAARYRVADLPIQVTLDDSSAMMPQMKLSLFPQVTVGARISASGDPVARPGDLSGEISPVSVTAGSSVDILINQVVE